MQNLKMVPLGFQQLTAAELASATNLTVPDGAQVALLNAETDNVRWRDDGTAPSATVGMLITADGDPWEYWGNLYGIQVIRASSDSILNISYYSIAG